MQVTKQELVEWADQEGGWASFMQHGGVGEDDVPMEIRAKWVDALNAWKDFEYALERLTAELPSL